MSKFNGTNKSTPTNKNMAGGVSYDRPIKKEIVSVVLNSMLNGDSYYEKETERLKRIEALISAGAIDDAEFVAKAMVFTRTEGRLRSVSHYMAGLLAEKVKGTPFLKSALTKSFVRPDDLTEVLALWNSRNKGKMIPNSLRRAFKEALETKFDEYQFKKYAATKSKTKLKDVVKLAHPSPKNFEDQTIFKRLIEDKLANIVTAQTINASSVGNDRVVNYMNEIKSNKLGYFAAIKNIRTLMDNNVSENDLKIWSNFITDPIKIKKSMLLPFRFIDAWNSVEDLPVDEFKKRIVKNALEKAFAVSTFNIGIVQPNEKIAILLDESSSMGSNPKSPFTIGKTLAAAIKYSMNKNNCLFYTWSHGCKRRDIDGSVFDFINNTHSYGGGTDVAAPLKKLIETNTFVDKIVIFTDMQLYGLENLADTICLYLDRYKKINPNVKLLFWNLEGYRGGAPIDFEKTQNVFEINGFSDNMLNVIPKLWSNPDYLIESIENITL